MALAFEQQPKESDKAFAAFSLYLSMGPQRSTAIVAAKLGKSLGLIERWCTRWHWLDRVAAYTSHMAAVERESTEALTRAKAPLWLKRKEEHKEVEWAMRGELVEAGRKILESFRDGSKGATLGDVARALELASKLGRLATGMETDRTEITGEDGGPIKVELEVALRKIYGDANEPPRRGDADKILEAEVVGETPTTARETRALPRGGDDEKEDESC